MTLSTRDKLMDAAQALFAKNGFYGTSIREIAEQVGLTKQALLHHFKSKEKLYSAVLARVASVLMNGVKDAIDTSATELEQLDQCVDYLSLWPTFDEDGPLLVMREILDNQERAAEASNWVMSPMIDQLKEIVQVGQEKGLFKPVSPLLFIYFMLGAQHYFMVSQPTLRQLSQTEEEFQTIHQLHVSELKQLIHARLLNEHPC